MESWRTVWRKGLRPLLSRKALEALRKALADDDRRLLQGVTTVPPTLQCVADWPIEAACLIGIAGWHGQMVLPDEGPTPTVGEIGEFFASACFAIDQRLGEPAACRWLLHWFDDTPRDEMRRLLLPEVELALAEAPAADVA